MHVFHPTCKQGRVLRGRTQNAAWAVNIEKQAYGAWRLGEVYCCSSSRASICTYTAIGIIGRF